MKVSGPLFQTERVFASIFLLSLLASLLFLLVKLTEKKIIKGV
jgi:ABC-type nitrate/sulfonate/bicarbonate transport system permease component